jgi:hypothetical protein
LNKEINVASNELTSSKLSQVHFAVATIEIYGCDAFFAVATIETYGCDSFTKKLLGENFDQFLLSCSTSSYRLSKNPTSRRSQEETRPARGGGVAKSFFVFEAKPVSSTGKALIGIDWWDAALL